MAYAKHNWMQYGRQGEVVEIKIMDASGGKIDNFRCNNNKDYPKVLKIIKDKYGFDPSPEIKIEDSPNFNKETNWLKEETKLFGL